MSIRLSREEQLLVHCARLELSQERQLQLERLLQEKLSWEDVLRKAQWYRTSALLFHHLRPLSQECNVPSWVMGKLQAVYIHNAARNLYLRSELGRVLKAFESEAIPSIVLKGSALLETTFTNPALRPMQDVDLLVPEEMAEYAYSLVCQLGYKPAASLAVQELTRQQHHHLAALAGEDNQLAVFEIHSHIVPRESPHYFNIAGFWERARVAYLAGAKTHVPAPEDMLTHLAVHFFLDRRFKSWFGLSQICDIAETLRRYQEELDWALVESQVRGGMSGPLYCGLSLARTLLDAPVSEDFLERIRPAGTSQAVEERFARRRVLDTKRVLATALVKPQSSYSLGALVKGLWGRLFPTRSYLAERYGDEMVARAPYRSHLRRLGDVWTVFMQYLRSPRQMMHEIQIDRWIHSISSAGPNGNHVASDLRSDRSARLGDDLPV
jgi:hypothetical protein